MANFKISQLTNATTPLAGTETLAVVQSGATVKVDVSNLTANRAVTASSITATNVKTSPTTANLDISGNTIAATGTDTNINITVTPKGTGALETTNLTTSGNTILGDSSTDTLNVGNNGLIKDATGNVAIGSATASYKFNVIQSNNNASCFSSGSNGSYTEQVFLANCDRAANSAYQFLQAYSGNFGDLEFNLRGDGNGYADGTWNNNGADYAEFFESANGQALTLGATVVLDGNKIREATDQDPASAIIGVVRPKEPSKASMVVGNTAWNKWANKYLTDDFDRYIMEDHDVVEWTDEKGKAHSYESHNIPDGITVPDDATIKTHDKNGNKFQHYKLNPAWDKDTEYVNRENRPEWNIIGLLGQVKILKGRPVGDRWIKMQNISEAVEEWFIR